MSKRPPNVLLIISDDQGYGDISCYGGAEGVQTPNMDRIAAAGARFTQGYVVSPICSPSRSGILYGRHPVRSGNTWFCKGGLPTDRKTLATALGEQGYATGYIGKVHYDAPFIKPDDPGFPTRQGFEDFYGYCHHTIHYLKHTQAHVDEIGVEPAKTMGIGPMWDGEEKRDAHGYSTDIFGQKACDFIEAHKEEPFFLQVAFNAVHLFIHQLPEEVIRQYNLETVDDWDPKKEAYLDWYKRTLRCDKWFNDNPEHRRLYLATLDLLDKQVGRILDTVEQAGLSDDTLIIYLSDNGGSPRTCACNAPLTGSKYTLSEGGVRVPFMMSWPGVIPGGTVVDAPVSSLDIYPMAMAAATGTDWEDQEDDGINQLPVLTGASAPTANRTLCWNSGWEWAVRVGDWKLWVTPRDTIANLVPVGQGKRLFNVAEDPAEQNNLFDAMPDKVAELEQAYAAWEDEVVKGGL